MQPEILDAIAETIVENIKSYTAPLEQRLEALAREPGPQGPAGKDGRDGEAGKDAPAVDLLEVAKQAAALVPPPAAGRDGADADVDLIVSKVLGSLTEQIAVLVSLEVGKAVAAIERPRDGRDGADGKDGQSVTVDDLAPVVVAEVTKAVSLIERPKDGTNGRDGIDGKDGQSVTVEQVAPVIMAEVTKAIEALPKPKDGVDGRDGVGVAGALLDKSGNLVLTLSNGSLHPLGVVVGAKGDPGKDGRDGENGFGFDDLSVDGGDREVAFVFRQGERVKSFPIKLPVPIHRGLWDATKSYERGDCVQWGGSMWHAVHEIRGMKPGDGPVEKTGWMLVAKKGGDGKNGINGEPGKPGRDGKDGVVPKW